jgi:Ca2+-binding EF-hand superfamily protein
VQRRWLVTHGKGKYIDFTDKQLRKLRNCFNSLDDDGSGAIGVDELEDPLIALGLVDTRQQVKDLVDAVDEDASEMIEFNEFLSIIKGGSAASKEEQINKGQKTTQAKEETGTAAIYNFF